MCSAVSATCSQDSYTRPHPAKVRIIINVLISVKNFKLVVTDYSIFLSIGSSIISLYRDTQTGHKSKGFSRIVPLLVFLVQKKESPLQAKICIMVKNHTIGINFQIFTLV